jgi:SSS family solute:Na+ symporter/sodium/proline symporter
MESPENGGACFPPFPQTLEIEKADFHIPSAPGRDDEYNSSFKTRKDKNPASPTLRFLQAHPSIVKDYATVRRGAPASGTLTEPPEPRRGNPRMSLLYVLVLAVIVAVLLAVALYRTTQVKTKADYLVAGRSLPAVVLVLTLLTSWIGAGSLFAGAENAYKNGFAALWQPAGGWLGLLLIYFIAPRARKFAQFTLPDLLEVRYNQTARVLGTIAILFAYIGITSYQFKGGGDVLHLIFPTAVSPELGTYIIAVFVIVTTALAGMSSVAYMDVAIGSLVTVICVIAAPVLFLKTGGWAGLHAALPPEYFQVLGNYRLSPEHVRQSAGMGVIRALEFLVPTLLLMLGNQVMYQKFFSARSERDARVSVIGWILGTLLLETLIVAIAVFGRALYPTGEVALHPREIIPYTARHGLPAFMGAVLLGAVFAKVISTASNYLFSPATNLVEDVFVRYISPGASNKRVLIVSRLAVVLLGCWALYQAVYAESILKKMLWAYTIYSAALTPVVLAAFYSKRVTAWGAVAAIGTGTAVTLAWDLPGVRGNFPQILADRDAIFPALFAALAAMIVVSLFTRKPSVEQLEQFSE